MQINELTRSYFKYFKTATSVLFWLLLIFGFGGPKEGMMTVISAAVHEAGHFFYTLLFLKSPSPPIGVLSGLRMKKRGVTSYGEEIMLYLSGPIANLTLCILLLPCLKFSWDFAKDLILINAFTMLSNLLPVEGYDGYGAILALSSMLGAEWRVRGMLRYISFSFTVLMTLVSLYLMYYLNGGYWIFAVFSISSLSFIKKSLKSQKRRFSEI